MLVLYCDERADRAEAVRQVLRSHVVLHVSHPRAIPVCLSNVVFDAVVMQVSVPDRDAYDVMRRGEIPSGTRIVILADDPVLLEMAEHENAARWRRPGLTTLLWEDLEKLAEILREP